MLSIPDLKKVTLREIISFLLRKGGPYEEDQARLGADIGLKEGSRQSIISQLKSNSPRWEEHWRAFWLILDICKQQGIESARDLEGIITTTAKEVTDAGIRKKVGSPDPGTKGGGKK